MTHDELTALEADLEQFREWLDGPGPEFPPVEEIDRLAAKISEVISLAHRELECETRVSTHAPGCHAWGSKHYDCLMREYEAVRADRDHAQSFCYQAARAAGAETFVCAETVPLRAELSALRAALEADAPALLAAKIAGLREAALMIYFNEECSIGGSKAVQERHEGNVSGLGYAAAIDARIAELQAETEKAGAPTAATRIKADE